jgi:hypothetical protein
MWIPPLTLSWRIASLVKHRTALPFLGIFFICHFVLFFNFVSGLTLWCILYTFWLWYFFIVESDIPYIFCLMFAESERAPLLRSYLQTLQRMDDYTESTGNFYSPKDSPQSMFVTECYVLSRYYLVWSSFIIPSFDHILGEWNPVHIITVIFLKYFFYIVEQFMIQSRKLLLLKWFLHQYDMLALCPAIHTPQIIPSVALIWFWCPCIFYCLQFLKSQTVLQIP